MYWPARYCMRSLAGSCSFSTITSSARRSITLTRQGSFLTCTPSTPAISRTSISRSHWAVAQHSRASPRVRSSLDSAEAACGRCSTCPWTICPLQEPQAPFLQP